MKKVIGVSVVVFLIALIFAGSAFADLPGSGWWSSIFVQNIGGGPGQMEMTAYGASAEYGSALFDFNHGQALAYNPGKTLGGAFIGFTPALPPGFEGSVVVSASVPVAAVSELANYQNGPVGVAGGTAVARYQGMSAAQVDTSLGIASIKNNFGAQTTTLYVQAAGADANVTVTYTMADGNVYTQTQAIAANKMFMFDPTAAGVPSTNCGFDGNTSPCHGAATITSTTGPIAAIVVEHPHTGSPAGFALSTRAQTSADQDTTLFHPTIKNDFWGNMNAGATVMNVGDAPALVRITLTVTNVSPGSTAQIGQVYTDQEIVAPGESVVFSKWRGNFGGMPSGTFAAGIIESVAEGDYTQQPLVGSTNDRKDMTTLREDKGISLYNGFADRNTTTTVAAPTLVENINNVTSSITVQNVGAAPTHMTFTYYEYGTSNVYRFRTINPIAVGEATVTTMISARGHERFTILDGFTSWAQMGGKQYSVIVTADQPIIGLVSEFHRADLLDIGNYEAINLD